MAIPAGGVPVGVEIARTLCAPISLAIVRKIQIPGNTEAGFGAVSWDGQVLINEQLRTALGLSQGDVTGAGNISTGSCCFVTCISKRMKTMSAGALYPTAFREWGKCVME
jgi:hypothetical protein